MNFNNINGVWPQIKDYIDSKLGGGTSKYKHMIYVQYLAQNDFVFSTNYRSNDGNKYLFIKYPDISNAWAAITNNGVYYGAIKNGVLSLYGLGSIQHDVSWSLISEIADKLPEGWYINYMGQIYDWKGNIVE